MKRNTNFKLKPVTNKKHRKDLNKSHNQIGQLYPVLRDAEGKVIDGYHRLDIDPNWKSIILEDVRTEEDRLIVHAHSNFMRRSISKQEKMDIVNRLGEIYYQQGLRPDAKVQVRTKGGRWGNEYLQTVTVNQIKNKIAEVLNGCLTSRQIRDYLLPKYKNQDKSEERKRITKKRHKNTSAWDLLLGSREIDLKRRYGDNFFDRLKNEMLNKTKIILRFDRDFINIVKAEIKEEVEEEIRIKIEDEIREKLEKEIRTELKLEMNKNIEYFYNKVLDKSQYDILNDEFCRELKIYHAPDS